MLRCSRLLTFGSVSGCNFPSVCAMACIAPIARGLQPLAWCELGRAALVPQVRILSLIPVRFGT